MNRQELLQDINDEYVYQKNKCVKEFDDKNTAHDWVTYITRYATRAAEFSQDRVSFEGNMIKVAALAVAAIEAGSV